MPLLIRQCFCGKRLPLPTKVLDSVADGKVAYVQCENPLHKYQLTYDEKKREVVADFVVVHRQRIQWKGSTRNAQTERLLRAAIEYLKEGTSNSWLIKKMREIDETARVDREKRIDAREGR